MAALPSISVKFTGSAASAVSAINKVVASLEKLGEAATASFVALDDAFAAVGKSVDAMAAQVVESSDAAGLAIAALDEKSAAIGAGFAAGSDEAVAALARLTEASKAAAAAVEETAVATKAAMEESAVGIKAAAEESSVAAEGMGAKFLGLGEIGSQIKAILPLSLAAVGYESVKMASAFQKSTTQLVTSAGESEKAIGQVRSGMLDMAGQVGVKADDLSKAMYYVEAAGFHAADGLTVLKAAAQGAAAEGADTTTVAQALTDVLVDYHRPASDAADVTSKMITAVAHGKTNLQDFAGSFASIVPAASAAGISFDDVGAALANMTNHGFTAQRASQNLAQALRSLLNPTTVMQKAFDQYGVSSETLKQKLHGPNGLTDAMEYLSQAASKAGKEGTPEFAAALKSLMGTAPGANAALATVGANYKATADTITAMGHATADAQGKVQGFALVQQTLGFQLKQIRAGFDSFMIRLGDGLIPLLTKGTSGLLAMAAGAGKLMGQISSGFSGKAAQSLKPVMQKVTLDYSVGKAPGIPMGIAAPTTPAPFLSGKSPGIPSGISAPAPPPPSLTAWQQVGQVLKGVADNFKKFGEDCVKAFHSIVQASGPTLQLLGTALLGALKAVASILANVVGPALVKVSGFLNQNKGIVRDLIAVALAPLALRLSALAIIKPIGAIAGLAKDVAMFPFSQAKSIFEGIKTGIGAASSAATRAREIWGGLRFGAVTVGGAIKDAFKKIPWSDLAQGAKDFGSKIAEITVKGGKAAWQGVTTGITAAKDAMTALKDSEKLAAAWTKIQAGAQLLLDAAMDANPIGLIIIAIAALVGIIIYCWTHFKTFRDIVKDVWAGIVAAAQAAWTWLVQAFHGIVDGLTTAYHGMLAVGATLLAWVIALPSKILGFLAGLGSSLGSWATSAWTRAKDAAVSVAGTLLSWLNGFPGRILSAVGNLGSLLWSAGKSIINGLWNGIASMGSWLASQIMGFIKSFVPGPVLKILGIGSPSKVFHEIGTHVTEGLAGGITAGASTAARASTAMAHAVIGGFSDELEISSPSKKFASLGSYVLYGLVQGLTGSTASVKAATKRIASNLYVDFGGSHRALQNYVNAEDRQLTALANNRDSVATRLKAAQKNLASIQADWAKEQQSIAGNIMQSASIIAQSNAGGQPLSAQDVVSRFQAQFQQAQQFATQLQQLQKEGLRSDLVQQLASAGAASAGETVSALASGSKGQIQQLNQMQDSMQSAANGVGAAVADSMYGAGMRSAQGLVQGLQSQEQAIENQMMKIAKSMQSSIKRALGIRSPSTVMAELGDYTAQGMAVGIHNGTKHALAAAQSMAMSVRKAAELGPGYMGAALAGLALGGPGGGAGSQTAQVQVTVQLDRKVLYQAMQTEALRYGRRNPTTGLAYTAA